MTSAVRATIVIAATGVFLAATPATAQSRFDDVRLVTARHRQGFRKARFDEARGALISDAQQRRLRFEGESGRALDLPFDRLVALHSESSGYPQRIFRRSGLYLVVHYSDPRDTPLFAIFRLSVDTAEALFATIERDTGRVVDQTRATESFLGLPIHVLDGDSVVINRKDGPEIRGRFRSVAPDSLEVNAGTFEATSIRQIRVTDSIAEGVVFGGLIAALPAGLLSLNQCVSNCTLWYPFTPGGWGVIAGGIAIGAAIDAATLRTAYRSAPVERSARSRWAPVITGSAHTLRVSWRFRWAVE
jgi:hypothetical protein